MYLADSYLDEKYGPTQQQPVGLSTSQSNVTTPKPFIEEHKTEIAYGVVVALLVIILAVGIAALVMSSKKAARSSRHDS